ncbi:MAG: hypothetical protein NC416_12975 [Eubacterium sp.]|nr:hypothetical protein [Eubacterium sp.]
MREILRVENIRCGQLLNGYDLSIHQGEIVYIQCLLDQSLDCLNDILAGNLQADEGKIYVHESEIPLTEYDSAYAMEKGIYAVSFADEYMENATIAENIMPMKPFWHLFSKKKIDAQMKSYFTREQVPLDPDTPVWMLGKGIERKKLGLLKARLLHMDLVLINVGREVVEGKIGEELWNMIRKLHEGGMTFLILSSCYTFLSEFATRTQFLHQGKALKEWTVVPDQVREKLKFGNFFQTQRVRTGTERYFIGLYDYECDLKYDFWSYLKCVQRYNPQIWDEYIRASVPDSGVSCLGKTAVVPRNSQDMLFENLSIGENLTIAARERVTYTHTGIVKKRLQKKVEEIFAREQNWKIEEVSVRELSALQRKILSIARLEILKPEVIILELPYQGISMDEIPALQSYFMQLIHRGIRIVYFSKMRENMLEDCKVIIRTQNGMSAKIDTFS